MTFLTRDILEFYKYSYDNEWFLNKFYTNTKDIGLYEPYKENPVMNAERASAWLDGEDKTIQTVDDDNTYRINRFGFRGGDEVDADILASGCSITFGLGLPESARWTNLLGNKFNEDVLNVGSPGADVPTVCQNIIQYCMANKMPKKVFCLFPDFFRRMVLLDKEFYNSKTSGTVDNDELLLSFCSPTVNLHKNSIFMEVEDTKYIEDSRSPHQLIFESITFIYMLESFCSTNNIELHWTTWHLPTSMILDEMLKLEEFKLKRFKSFFPPRCKQPANYTVTTTCDSDHNSEFKDHVAWGRGSDYSIIDGKKTTRFAHPGIHFQYHVADLFYDLSQKEKQD